MAAHSEDFVTLACAVLIGLKGVTGRQTDDGAKTREALHAVARKNGIAGLCLHITLSRIWGYNTSCVEKLCAS